MKAYEEAKENDYDYFPLHDDGYLTNYMIKLAVILPAAGTGSRMRSETPNPFYGSKVLQF